MRTFIAIVSSIAITILTLMSGFATLFLGAANSIDVMVSCTSLTLFHVVGDAADVIVIAYLVSSLFFLWRSYTKNEPLRPWLWIGIGVILVVLLYTIVGPLHSYMYNAANCVPNL